MKNLICLIISIVFAISIHNNVNAQGNLEFNQVIILTMDEGTDTVPAGKVWKIEYASLDAIVTYLKCTYQRSSGTTGCAGDNWRTYTTTSEKVDGQGTIVINSDYVITDPISTPIWLGEGNTVAAYVSETPVQPSTPTNYKYTLNGSVLCGPYTPTTENFSGIVSIIEFNVVP